MSIIISHVEDYGLHEVYDINGNDLQDLVNLPKDPKQLEAIGGVNGLAQKLRSSTTDGLQKNANALSSRAETFGKNVLPDPPMDSLFTIMKDTLKDETLIILIIAAVVSIILGSIKYTSENPKTGWIEGVAILFAVIIVTIVTSINNFKNQQRFQDLNKKSSDRQVKVVRAGEQCVISVFNLLVGDVLMVDTGDIVCTDGVFIDGHSIVCDESSITGESNPIKKGHDSQGFDPLFISGTIVQEGFGKMMVTAVGVNSINGKILMSLRTETEDTPLQEKLGELADRIGKFGLGAAVLLLLIVIPKYFLQLKVDDIPITTECLSDITKIVVSAITIVVVAVPEGLPLAVTVALAYGMLKMYKENNLVRNMASCETMGGATTICSDKTGTLTTNQMTVVAGHISKLFENVDHNVKHNIPAQLHSIIVDGICLNSNAYEGVSTTGRTEFIGSKTECALLKFVQLFGADYQTIRSTSNIKKLYPFTSTRKRMAVLVELGNGRYRLYVKGASEIILGRCSTYFDENGNVQQMGNDARRIYEDTINRFATDTLRTIGLAYSDFDLSQIDLESADEPSQNLCFIGVVGIRDPIRPEVPHAVAQFKRAGVIVRMVTGDNLITAQNIAKKCGILSSNGVCLEGPEFQRMTNDEIDRVLPRLQVLARSSPLDKRRLVERLKEAGEIVAVTGDGTNDGPALKMAHVGFSMGVTGTEVAIAASDVVLLDDNFASIVRALLWGRNIYDSICKFLQFQLTINIVAVIVALVGNISGNGESPLTVIQLLWVNLIMDTLAALALATDPPHEGLLDRPPRGKDAPLISRTMWRDILGQAAFQLCVQFFLLYRGAEFYNNILGTDMPDNGVEHYTMIFNTFVFLQLFNEINSRVLGNSLNIFKHIFNNPLFIIIWFVTIGIQIVFVTFGGEATATVKLSIAEWGICVLTGVMSLPLGFLLRLIPIKNAQVERSMDSESTPLFSKSSTRYSEV
ncbi:hypothetical protein SAMD00019534_095090 [Acytostelium subglobosum LB1]|uniref:hypothetical protein n=1 Tax=Acytostelium subglobosum LB1 TaxID=1410327 RepID=UPI00064501D0|nr:hypothetical protein SAMD00019534_095090 [Acytostelium subglobosum LB1]GAM26334.1 hypothetical protein SAMD00019534_095090 [Acytostelium subglobosum LB1]|eukprot:XP_012750888.1 hypothetical protein SAMD00019534_095090 [Acytostelium subglobosum LB1]